MWVKTDAASVCVSTDVAFAVFLAALFLPTRCERYILYSLYPPKMPTSAAEVSRDDRSCCFAIFISLFRSYRFGIRECSFLHNANNQKQKSSVKVDIDWD
jgi:hypothetical protein